MRLEISNEADEWVTVTRSVLDVHGMKIYYNEEMVAAQAKMNIISETKAETEFIETAQRTRG